MKQMSSDVVYCMGTLYGHGGGLEVLDKVVHFLTSTQCHWFIRGVHFEKIS